MYLREVAASLQSGIQGFKCIKLRQIISECQISPFQQFDNTSYNDADEFLEYLVDKLFKIVSTERYVTVLEPFDQPSSAVYRIIPAPEKSGHLSELLLQPNYDDTLSGYATHVMPVPNDFLVIVLGNRKNFPDKFDIIPDRRITFKNEKTLALSGVVMGVPGHYVSVVRRGSEWFYLNDLHGKEKAVKYESYDKMIQTKRLGGDSFNVTNNGRLFMYTLDEGG